MSADTQKREMINFIEDPLYNALDGQISCGKDTAYKNVVVLPPQNTSQKELAQGGLANQRINFMFSQNNNSKIRFNHLFLKMTAYITTTAYGAVDALKCSPEPFAIPKCIQQIEEIVNGETTYIANQNYVYEVMTRVLSNWSREDLDHADHCLLTPVFDKEYVVRGSDAAGLERHEFQPKLLIAPNTFGAGAPAAEVDLKTPKGEPSAYWLRNRKWVGDVAGANSHQRELTFMVPVNGFLVPEKPDHVSKMMRTYQINLTFNDFAGTCLNTQAAEGRLFITKVEAVYENYVQSAIQQSESVTAIKDGQRENVGYLRTHSYEQTFNGGDIVLNNVKNLQRLWVFMPVEGRTNGQGGANDVRTYTSTTQMRVSALTAGAGAYVKRAIDDTNNVIQSVQFQYSGIIYPQTHPNYRISNNKFDPMPLWLEYLKSRNVLNKGESVPIEFEQFMSTCPFICLHPFSTEAPKYTPVGSDVILKLRGLPEPTKLIIVYETLEAYIISNSGFVTQML